MKNISLDIFVCTLFIIVKSAKTVWVYPPIFPYTYNLDPVCLTESWCNIEKIKMGWCKGSGIALMLEGGAAYFFSAELWRNRTNGFSRWLKKTFKVKFEIKIEQVWSCWLRMLRGWFSKKNVYFFLLHIFLRIRSAQKNF